VQVRIITPEGAVLDEQDVTHVLLPAENGELGILPGHIAMVCNLGVGRIRIDRPDGQLVLATSGGFAEVRADHIMVLAETAEKADEIDVERARQARDRATQDLAKGGEEAELAKRRLARALNRLRIAQEGRP